MELTNEYYDLKARLESADSAEEINECYNAIHEKWLNINMPNLEWTVGGNAWMELHDAAVKRMEE